MYMPVCYSKCKISARYILMCLFIEYSVVTYFPYVLSVRMRLSRANLRNLYGH